MTTNSKIDARGGARPGSGRKPTNVDSRRALFLWESGFSYKHIAEKFGVSLYIIRNAIERERNKPKN